MGILTLTTVIRYHVGLLMPKNLWTSGFWGTFSANASKTQILLIHVGYHSVSIVLNSLAKAEAQIFWTSWEAILFAGLFHVQQGTNTAERSRSVTDAVDMFRKVKKSCCGIGWMVCYHIIQTLITSFLFEGTETATCLSGFSIMIKLCNSSLLLCYLHAPYELRKM